MKRRDFMAVTGASLAAAAAVPRLAIVANDIESRVKDILSRMTLDEKIDQMSGRIWRDAIQGIGRDDYVYTGYTPANERLGAPALKCFDGPRGVGLLHKTTCFPVAMARGATWSPDLERRAGEGMGYEARALKANMLLAPCVNVLRHPSYGRAQESYGEDPLHIGTMAAAFVTGLQNHVMACVKHYAANNIDESRMFVNVIVDERTLREVYLPHFKMCVEAGAASLMSAYNDVNGELCAHNDRLIRDILKGDWAFDGFVVSDWIQAVEDTVEAANAGLDVEMPRAEHYGAKLKRAVKKGKVKQAVVDEAVTRILRKKLLFNRIKGPYRKDKIAGAEHTALAREIAQKSIVLLKNEGGLLPLKIEEIESVAVFGKLAEEANLGDHGSSRVTPPYAVSPLEGLTKKIGDRAEVVFNKGDDISKAGETARDADVAVIVAGLTWKDEGEGKDRENLSLKPEEERLIKALCEVNRNCVVILEGGSAITMENWVDAPRAILMAWYPGMEGGNAIADILCGDVNPSAKLPILWPRSAAQLFPFDNKARTVEYGYYHGYRYFDKKDLKPRFHFGFGLSYTSYRCENLRLDKNEMSRDGKIIARVDVTNAGDMTGEEVVQLYGTCNNSRVDRPTKDLKAFKRVPLSPGQTETVELELRADSLPYYNVQSGGWEVEKGEYTVYVGPSSAPEDLLSAPFRIV